MEENRARERGLAVQRVFAPNRLSEDVLRLVYDRLLEGAVPPTAVEDGNKALVHPLDLPLILTGGPS